MTTRIYSQILRTFAAKTAPLNTAFTQDNMIFATDGVAIVFFEKSKIKNAGRYEERKYLSVVRTTNLKYLHSFEVEELEALCEQHNARDSLPCEDCAELGTVIVHYFSVVDGGDYEIKADCPVCNGSGQIKNSPLTNYAALNSVYLDIEYLNKLIKIAKMLNVKIVLCDLGTQCLFRVGDVTLMIMRIISKKPNPAFILKLNKNKTNKEVIV